MCFLCHLRWLCCRLEKRIADTSKVFFAGFSHVSSHQSAKADARTSALCAAVAVDRFRGRYSDPQTSGLSFEVVDGLNTVPPIDVQVP